MSGVKRGRLTEADWATVRRALSDAIDERSSYADAWARGTPERAAAEAQVKRYEAVNRKLFGTDSFTKREQDALDALPSKPITQIWAEAMRADDEATLPSDQGSAS